jgi:hypothetical protein
MTITRHGFKSATAGLLACIGLTACVALPPPTQSGGQGGPRYEPAPVVVQQGPRRYDPTGRWCFRDGKGQNAMNMIELRDGGILASPIGRKGNEAFYRDAGPNLYQHSGGATYEFYNDEQGVWRSGKNVWPHRRCG